MNTEQILNGYDAENKKVTAAMADVRGYLEAVLDDYSDKEKQIKELEEEKTDLKNKHRSELEKKKQRIEELEEIIYRTENKEITDFLPQHLNNLRYAMVLEKLFDNIENIDLDKLEALTNNQQLATIN